ncbi:MAG: hypothetical protein QXJ28_00355 [Candidatus Pacearchaeota archaeon]
MIKLRGGKVTFLFLLLALTLTNVYSAVYLSSQPDAFYNIGDTLSVILSSDGQEGWASVHLSCGEASKMLYFQYTNKPESSTISAPITKKFLSGMMGDCRLIVSFNQQEKQSFPFKISDKIDITANFGAESVNPGEEIEFTGTVSKPNGRKVEGSVEVRVQALGLEQLASVVDNKFSGKLLIPNSTPAGEYSVFMRAYEKNNEGDITNIGETSNINIKVNQKPKTLNLEVKDKILPGSDLYFESKLYDQTSMLIDKAQVVYRIKNPKEKEVYNKLANTDEKLSYSLAKDSPYGFWTIIAESFGLIEEKKFYVEKLMAASFEMINSTLKITSIGNVPYNKSIEIKIGNDTIVSQVTIDPHESVIFDLTAPDGLYSVEINDGNNKKVFDSVPLTGKSISIDGTGAKDINDIAKSSRSILAWIFLILVAGLFLLINFRRYGTLKLFIKKDKEKRDTKYDLKPAIKLSNDDIAKTPVIETPFFSILLSMYINPKK